VGGEATTQPAKHTPGPWIVHTFTISGKEKLEVLDATGTNACVQANAHLIAAAPAMYEALQEALKCIEKHVPKTEFAPRQWIREVLAQAEGKQ
jgi:hypothetical protein